MIQDIKNYEGWGLYKGNIINQNESFGNRLTIFGIKRNTNMIKPVVRTGRWLVDNDKNEIVVNHLFFEYNPEYKLNDDIILKIKGKKYNFKIVGMAVRPDPSAIFINYDYLVSITDDKNLVSNILVDTPIDIFKDQLNVMKNIEKYFFDNDIFISSSMMVKEFVKILEDHFLIIVSLLMMMSFFIVIVGGLGLITTMSIQVIERTREIGILKAIGASNHSIIKTILIEGFVIGIISWIIAIIFSVPASMLIGYILGMTFFELPLFIAVNPLSIFIWLGIILSFSTISSFIPAFKAVKLQVRDTLGYE
jgi:putative ABC transport system permease protein